ncbi:unnamed protein product, partial [Musa textilis]
MKPIIGDILVISGTFCFAFSNVGEEYCVKKKDLVEVVTMLGIFGVLLGYLPLICLQKKKKKFVAWSFSEGIDYPSFLVSQISLFVGFTAASLLSFTIIPFVLKLSGATLFSLSLLTSDIWALVIRIFFYRQQVDWLYYLAFGLVAIGLIIYIVK